MNSLSELKDFLDQGQISEDSEQLFEYGKDWTSHYKPHPLAVVFPKTTEQVQEIVRWARRTQTALVPSGGRTGLSAGATATQGEVVVSFEKMNQILDFNPTDQTITCQAGVVTEQLQQFAKEKGFYYPVDFAARGSSQIGGNIATNAGGIKVIRYGLTRSWVASLEVVTGAGQRLQLNRSLVKNATGYDLRHLFIGSEGTLGFITEATLSVTRPPGDLRVFLFAVPELSGVMKIYEAYQKAFPLMAFEMFTDRAAHYVTQAGHLSLPFDTRTPYYVLMELDFENGQVMDESMSLFENCLEEGWCEDGTLSQNSEQAQQLWKLREDISEATSPYEPYKNDVSVRISKVPEFLTTVNALLQKDYPDFEVVWFGHIGDGNLHINILKPKNLTSTEFVEKCKKVDAVLFKEIQKLGGSISAEHGVGMTKKPFLHFTRSDEEIHLMKEIKKIFDPDGIINPGKVFD